METNRNKKYFAEKRLMYMALDGSSENTSDRGETQRSNTEAVGKRMAPIEGNILRKMENPDIPEGTKFEKEQANDGGLTEGHATLLLKDISDTVFPNNSDAALKFTSILQTSYEEKAPRGIDYGQIAKITIVRTADGFKATLDGKTNSQSFEFDFPTIPQSILDIKEKREELLKTGKAKRQEKQTEAAGEIHKSALEEKLSPLKIGEEIASLKEPGYKTFALTKNGVAIPYTISINNENPDKVMLGRLNDKSEIESQGPEVEIDKLEKTAHYRIIKAEEKVVKIENEKDKLKKDILGTDGVAKFKDKKQELNTKLRDLYDSEEGDEAVITRKGKSPQVAVYDSSRDNYYYKTPSGKFGKRAIFLSGDRVVFESKSEKSTAEKVPAGSATYGTYEIEKASQSATEIMGSIHNRYPELKVELKKYEISDEEYYQSIAKFRDGNTLNILKPSKSLKATMEAYKKEIETRDKAYNAESAKDTKRIVDESQKYLDKKFILSDQKLINYINNDKKWNDLWAKRGEQSDEYIDGLERVIAILTNPKLFDLKENELRDGLRALIQKGRNDRIDFNDVFKIFGRKIYKEGNEDDLVNEINQNKKIIEDWIAKDADQENLTTRPGYKEVFLPAATRFAILTNNVLSPIANLLDAIEGLKIKTSTRESFYSQNERILAGVERIKKGETSSSERLDALLGAKIAPNEKTLEISISTEAMNNFAAQIKEVFPEQGRVDFSAGEMMETILKLYSTETLAAEGCLKVNKENQSEIILTSLPKNFDLKNPKIKEIFTLTNGTLTSDKSKFEALAQIIDNNKVALEKIDAVYGNTEVATHLNWLEKIKAFFHGRDARSVELSMAGIANDEVTKPSDEFMDAYISRDAARGEVISKIISERNGATLYDMNKLQSELEKSFEIGLDSLRILALEDASITELYESVNSGMKGQIATFINTAGAKLDPNIAETIKIGHVMGRSIEAGKEEIYYSQSPEISAIQKQLIESAKGYTQKDINKVEEILLAGVLIGLKSENGATSFGGLGVGTSIALGDGWTLSPGIGVSGVGKVGVGVDISKSVVLSKGKDKVLTFGLTAGVLMVGGHVSLQFPISESVSSRVSAGAGVGAFGFYAGGGISFHKDTNFEISKKIEDLNKKVGFDTVDKLIASNASDEEVVAAITKLPGIGEDFKTLKEKYKLGTKGVLEIYNLKHEQLASNVTEENTNEGFSLDIIGGGVYGGIINGVPVAAAYLEIKVGEELVVVRSEVEDSRIQNRASELKIQEEIQKKIGSNATFLETTIKDPNNIIFDSQSGKYAILEENGTKQELDLSNFDTGAALDKALRENIGASLSIDPETGLSRINFNIDGDIKILVDPAIKEQVVVQGDKILMTMGANPDFTFTRENFYYPFEKEGSTKLAVITIKANPLRERSKIERESTSIVYKRAGYLPEIRKGISHKRLDLDNGQLPDILSYKEFENQTEKQELRRDDFLEKFDKFEEARKGLVKVGGELREGIVPADLYGESFAEDFYKKSHLSYKKSLTIGSPNYNPEQLVKDIQKFAKERSEKSLSEIELREVLTYLNVRGFSSIDGGKRKEFQRNLKFAERKLTQIFEQTIAELPEGKKPKYSTAEMVTKMIHDISDTDFGKGPHELPKGTRILSIVGTEGVSGLRGVLSEGEQIRTGILNLQEYDVNQDGISGEIAKMIIEINSPLETNENQEFMKSQLALKLAGHPGLGFAIGMDNALKVIECFKSGEISPENSQAFNEFKEVVIKMREYQLSGRNFIEMENGSKIQFEAKVGHGAYEGCGNASMTIHEDIAILVPEKGATAVSTDNYSRITAETKRKVISSVIGAAVEIFGGKKIERPEPGKDQPKPKPRPDALKDNKKY